MEENNKGKQDAEISNRTERKILLVSVPILALIIIVLLAVTDWNSSETTDYEPPALEELVSDEELIIDNEKDPEDIEEITYYALGENVEKGSLSFIINDFTETDSYNGHNTENKFVIISATATNIGKEPANIDNSYFILFDGEERKYDSSNSILYGEEYFSYDKINPGLSMSGKVAFEVPTDAEKFILALNDNMFSFDGTKYKFVLLE